MGWLNPNEWGTALCRHLCMTTFRDEIARETEEYRRQIEDHKQWRKDTEEKLTKLHALELDTIKKEAERDITTWEEKAKSWEDTADWLYALLYDACFDIATTAQLQPLRWAITAPNRKPGVRQLVNKIKAELPPLLPLPPMLQGLRLSDVLAPGPLFPPGKK